MTNKEEKIVASLKDVRSHDDQAQHGILNWVNSKVITHGETEKSCTSCAGVVPTLSIS